MKINMNQLHIEMSDDNGGGVSSGPLNDPTEEIEFSDSRGKVTVCVIFKQAVVEVNGIRFCSNQREKIGPRILIGDQVMTVAEARKQRSSFKIFFKNSGARYENKKFEYFDGSSLNLEEHDIKGFIAGNNQERDGWKPYTSEDLIFVSKDRRIKLPDHYKIPEDNGETLTPTDFRFCRYFSFPLNKSNKALWIVPKKRGIRIPDNTREMSCWIAAEVDVGHETFQATKPVIYFPSQDVPHRIYMMKS